MQQYAFGLWLENTFATDSDSDLDSEEDSRADFDRQLWRQVTTAFNDATRKRPGGRHDTTVEIDGGTPAKDRTDEQSR